MEKEFDVDFELDGKRIRKIVCAETEKVEELREIAEEFMEKIFGMRPGKYVITDESDLLDFSRLAPRAELDERIKEQFGVDVSDLKYGNLAEIFERIDMKRAF